VVSRGSAAARVGVVRRTYQRKNVEPDEHERKAQDTGTCDAMNEGTAKKVEEELND
jgi:hypothetical protein